LCSPRTYGGRGGKAPKYIVTDRGSQYRKDYRAWCRGHGVKPRFGAVGKKGSIAIVERFIKSLKVEALRRIWIWGVEQMRVELEAYAVWYNASRPHQALAGRTPNEVYEGVTPARDGPRFEPRKRFPLGNKPAKRAPAGVRGKRGVKLRLVVGCVRGRAHLPTVEIRRAA
jgi:putative transposase